MPLTFTGTASSTLAISGCTGAIPEEARCRSPTLSLGTGGTVTWVSGSTTTSGVPDADDRAGDEVPRLCQATQRTNPAADSFTATVTADTGDGMLIPATETGSVCVGTDGSITVLKELKFSWTASSISCTTISGSATLTVSGCTGGNTGGGSQPLSAATLATGGTIHWLSGGSTTIGAPALVATSATHCPGYVKGAASNPTAEKFTAAVTADTGDGLKLPGSAKGAVCVGTDGSISALKPLAAK